MSQTLKTQNNAVAVEVQQQSNSEVQLFENSQFGKIRIIMKDGDPWFVAKDVCKCLSISNSRDAINNLDIDEKADVGITDTSSNGIEQARNVNIISESGLYSLALRSRKPEAKQFKRWVTHDVLPSIRKTGSYSVNNNPQLTELTSLVKTVVIQNNQLVTQNNQLVVQNNQLNNKVELLAIENKEIQKENKEIRQELQVMKPKVQFYNLYVENDSTGVDCKTAAKIIGKMGRNKLFAFLRRKNLIMYDNMPYQKYVNLGLFGIKYSKTGFPVLMITKKGIEKIGQLLDNNS